MTLSTSVYTAHQGYAWFNVPTDVSLTRLNRFVRFIAAGRGDFPKLGAVELGLVADDKIAAAFSIRKVENWDCENRTADYWAFAFFPLTVAARIDFVELLDDTFFWTPSRAPATSLEYEGGVSAKISAAALAQLETRNRCNLKNPRAVGAMLAQCGNRSTRWVGLTHGTDKLSVECNAWKN